MGSSHYSLRDRRELLRLVVAGWSVAGAAQLRGVACRTAIGWVRLAGMEMVAGSKGGIVPLPPVLEPRVGHGRRLSLADRSRIEAGLEVGMSVRKIAGMIGAAPSTVSREIRRVQLAYRTETLYSADVACRWPWKAARRRSRDLPVGGQEICPLAAMSSAHV